MSRRAVLLIALISLAVLGAAAAPWTLSGEGLATSVAEHVREKYGLVFKAHGRSTFAALPIPRVKFENVELASPDRTLVAEGGTLRGELRLLPLLFGEVRLSEVALAGAKVTANWGSLRSMDWSGLIKDRRNVSQAYRLIVTGSSLHWSDIPGADLTRLEAVVRWTDYDEALYAVGSAQWRDVAVSLEEAAIYPALLATGQLSPVSLTLSAPAGRITVTGQAQLSDGPRITGESLVQLSSVRDFTRWSSLKLPFGPLMGGLSATGDFSLDHRRLSWPSVSVTLGKDKLEGTLAVRFDMERPLITGTLAADSLDLSSFFEPLAQARSASGTWSEEAIDLTHTTGSDLDLRLSASSAQLGRVRLDDMAAGVLVRPGKIEASLGRATLNKGTLKGRLSLAKQNGGTEVKTQGTFEGVDLLAFLNTIGEPRWIGGQAQGLFQFDGTGRTPAEIIRQSQGRTSVTVKDGELIGMALNDALRRVEKRPLLASLNWRSGRTPFDQAQVHLNLKDGIGEFADSRLSSPILIANLHGQLSLLHRTLNLKADVSPVAPTPSPEPAIVFDVSGGWDNIVVTPEARSLIQRSGAAKPLFGPERQPQNASSVANAQ